MNYAIVLAGGIGSRIKSDIPKQYIKVNNKPIICYCLETFLKNKHIDRIVIVAGEKYHNLILSNIKDNLLNKKDIFFSKPGKNRNDSIISGLNKIKEKGVDEESIVLVHDGARPNVDDDIIENCINGVIGFDGCVPSVNAVDTIYYGEMYSQTEEIIEREKLFCGQTPDTYYFNRIFPIMKECEKELINKYCASQIAVIKGLRIRLVNGKYSNFKITNNEDLDLLYLLLSK